MAYATLTDLRRLASERRLIELSDRADPPDDAMDQVVIEQALADASALADSYLAGRYQLPLDPVPEVLRRQVAVMAYYGLHIESAPDKVAADHKEAIRWLERVAAGAITLTATGREAAAADGGVQFAGPSRTFSRDGLAEY